jgi:hypothetical protein
MERYVKKKIAAMDQVTFSVLSSRNPSVNNSVKGKFTEAYITRCFEHAKELPEWPEPLTLKFYPQLPEAEEVAEAADAYLPLPVAKVLTSTIAAASSSAAASRRGSRSASAASSRRGSASAAVGDLASAVGNMAVSTLAPPAAAAASVVQQMTGFRPKEVVVTVKLKHIDVFWIAHETTPPTIDPLRTAVIIPAGKGTQAFPDVDLFLWDPLSKILFGLQITVSLYRHDFTPRSNATAARPEGFSTAACDAWRNVLPDGARLQFVWVGHRDQALNPRSRRSTLRLDFSQLYALCPLLQHLVIHS